MKRMIFGAVIGSVVGGIAFYPLAMPIILTIMLNTGIDSYLGPNSNSFGTIRLLFWFIPLVGCIFGGLAGGFIGKNKLSFAPFKNVSLSIILWFTTIFGMLGLATGFMFSWVTLIGLGNTTTAIDLWLFSGVVMVVGAVLGALIGSFVALIRLVINKFHPFNSPQVQ